MPQRGTDCGPDGSALTQVLTELLHLVVPDALGLLQRHLVVGRQLLVRDVVEQVDLGGTHILGGVGVFDTAPGQRADQAFDGDGCIDGSSSDNAAG